jgi:hypothetical protein
VAVTLTSDPIVTEAFVADLFGSDFAGDKARHYINAASSAFLTFTGRQRITEGAVSYEEPLPPPAVPVLYLRATPVDTAEDFTAEIYYEGDLDETLSTDDYDYNATTGRMRLHYHTHRSYGSPYRLKLTYTGGWTTVPHEIQQSALEMIQWLRAGAEGRVGVTSESREGFSTSFENTNIPASVRNVWQRYRVY